MYEQISSFQGSSMQDLTGLSLLHHLCCILIPFKKFTHDWLMRVSMYALRMTKTLQCSVQRKSVNVIKSKLETQIPDSNVKKFFIQTKVYHSDLSDII